MYGARLPYDRLKKLLKQVVDKGLIEEYSVEDRVYYRLTRKGVEALEELRRVKALLEEIGVGSSLILLLRKRRRKNIVV